MVTRFALDDQPHTSEQQQIEALTQRVQHLEARLAALYVLPNIHDRRTLQQQIDVIVGLLTNHIEGHAS